MIPESVKISAVPTSIRKIYQYLRINPLNLYLRDAMVRPPKSTQMPLMYDVYIQKGSHNKQQKQAKETLENTALENSHPATALRTRDGGEFFRCAFVTVFRGDTRQQESDNNNGMSRYISLLGYRIKAKMKLL